MFKRLAKIYPGWWLVFATGIIGLLGAGFANLAFSVIFKPIAAELGLSRAVTSMAPSIQNAAGAVLFLLGGMGSDRYGPRRMITIGIIIASMGCFMMYFVHSLWSFLIVWGVVVGAGIYLGFTFITDRAIVNWFVKKSGLAINLKFAIQAFAGITLLPLVAWLTASHGWRIAYIVAGASFLLICLPLAWIYVKPHRPEYYGLLPDGESPLEKPKAAGTRITARDMDGKAPEFTLKQTMKTASYWLYIALCSVPIITIPMARVHLVPFLTDRGIGLVQAASMMGMMNTVSIPSRLVVGYIMDRVKTANLRFISFLGLVLQFTGVMTFLILQNNFSLYLWLILYGIGFETTQGVNLPLLARFFGRKSYGGIMGLVITIQAPFMILGPMYVGWIYDSTGSYMNFIVLMAILTAVGAVMSLFLLPPKPPSGIPETAGVRN